MYSIPGTVKAIKFRKFQMYSFIYLFIYLFRCICICKPFVYQSLFTKKKTWLYCGLIWFTCGLLDSPNWIGWTGYTFRLKEMLCAVDESISHVYLAIRTVAALGKNKATSRENVSSGFAIRQVSNQPTQLQMLASVLNRWI